MTTIEFAEAWFNVGNLTPNYLNVFLHDLDSVIEQKIDEWEDRRPKDYEDTEADGFEFCGKCGKLKTV